ncbi:hypothetical protein [Okibacterium endophyticum]
MGGATVILFGLISLRADDSSFGLGGVILLTGTLLTFPLSSQASRPLFSAERRARATR